MRAAAWVRAPGGEELALFHGDVIGRLRTAALHLPDPRISEAHALISLRGTELKLLALRGVFAVDGKRRTSAVLKAGLRVELAAGLFLDVLDVDLPDEVLGLEGPGLPRQVLPGACSLVLDPQPSLQPGYVADSIARIFSDADGWWVARVDRESRPFRPGDELQVGDQTYRAVAVPLDRAGSPATRQGGLSRPLTVIAQFDTVHVQPEGRPPIVFGGVQARLLSELVLLDGPAGWEVVARQVWPGQDDRNLLRRRLDVALVRLRAKLRANEVRADLVRSDGSGSLELLLGPEDRVEDRT